MFGTIRKHQTWLWVIISALTIVSFVIFFSPYQKMSGSSGRENYGSINGEKVSKEQFADAWREVELRYFFMSGGRWADEEAKRMGFEPERDTYQWLLLVQKLNQAGIKISPELVAQTAAQMVGQFQRAGITSPEMFVTKVLEQKGISADDFQRYVQHSLGVQELIATVAVSGKLVTPQEAKNLYIREHQELSADAVLFSSSNYLAAVSVTPEAVAQYYTNHMAQFRTPERVQVSYVQFGVSNFLGSAEQQLAKTNLSELVDMNFQRLGTNYTRIGKTPEEAKAKIREELIRSQALTQAKRKAYEFADELFSKEPVRPENLQALAQTKGLTVQVTQPFGKTDGPQGLDVSPDFATKAFALNPTTDPFAGPLAGDNTVYVIAYNQKIPSAVPPLDSIREKVVEAFKQDQALNLARNAGRAAQATVTNAMAQGKTFEAACAEAKVTPVQVPPFSMSTRSLTNNLEDRISLSELKQVAFGTNPGKVSNFDMTSDGGAFVYVKSKLPVDEAKMKADLPLFVNTVRQQRQNEAFNEWFRKEAERGLRDTPLARQPQPPALGGSGASRKS